MLDEPSGDGFADKPSQVQITATKLSIVSEPKTSSWRTQGINGAVLLPLVITAVMFWWDKSASARAPLNIMLASRAEVVGRTEKYATVRLRLTAKNGSPREIDLIENYFHVRGIEVRPRSVDDRQYKKELQSFQRSESYGQVDRHVARDGFATISHGRFLQKRTWLAPGEEMSTERLIYVSGDYKEVEAEAGVLVAMDDTISSSTAEVLCESGRVDITYKPKKGGMLNERERRRLFSERKMYWLRTSARASLDKNDMGAEASKERR